MTRKILCLAATLALCAAAPLQASEQAPAPAKKEQQPALAQVPVPEGFSYEGRDRRVEWSHVTTWKADSKMMDLVHTLDSKYVYVLTKDHHVEIRDPRNGELQGRIPVEPGVTRIDIAPQGEALFLLDTANSTFTALAVDMVADIDITGSPFMGPEDAPVTIVIFTDFECPYCSKAAPLLEEVLDKNPDTVKVVYKGMPLRFHKNAQPAALAALAAREQGKFWQMHDALFAIDELSPEKIEEAAKNIGLDMEKFNKDRASAKVREALVKDLRDAQQAGVNSTPTIFVNGRKVKQRSLEGIQKMIDEELAESSAAGDKADKAGEAGGAR